MNELELLNELTRLRTEYKSKYDSYPEVTQEGKAVKNIPANDLEGLQKLMDDVNDAGKKYDAAVKARTLREDITDSETKTYVPANRAGIGGVEAKSLADALLESKQYAERDKGKGFFRDAQFDLDLKSLLDLESKATMTTSAGFAPFILRDGKVVPAISRPPQMIDFLRIEPTDKNAVKFMKQTTRTNAAAAKGENVALSESTIVYTEATVDIRKIGTYLPVTEEQLEDELEVRNLVETDLRLMVRQELDRLVTIGDGIAPNILGAYNAVGVLSQARGVDPIFDAIMKAMTKVKISGRAVPNLVLLHGNDYQDLALTRTADGMYIYGNPADAPLSRVWGVNLATSEALTEGTGMVMDSNYLRLKMRKDVTIAATDSHGELFLQNVTVLRAHLRAGLQILRDEAICRITGL